MSKYDPLTDYFRGLPLGEMLHILSFDEIEIILETKLPRTALIDRPWWANTQSSTHARRWLDAGWKLTKVELEEKCVTFTRLSKENETSKTIKNRYKNLQLFFKNIPKQQEQIAFTFTELGNLLGRKLPGTAFHDRTWWANTKSSPHGAAWVTSGWRVEKVFLKAQIVTFRRKGNNPLLSIPRYVKALLDGSAHLGRPSPRILVNWIRFCKRVDWYFEATVLYERGGLNTDSLDEGERAEVY